jgi:hypothetical protein
MWMEKLIDASGVERVKQPREFSGVLSLQNSAGDVRVV